MSLKLLFTLASVFTSVTLVGLATKQGVTSLNVTVPSTASAVRQQPAQAEQPATKASESLKTVNGVKKIKKLFIPSAQVVYLIGPVLDNAHAIAEEIKEKSKAGEDLYLFIDSPGGSVIDGASILSAMEASNVKIHTVCTSLCASMAYVIHQHGSSRLAADRAVLMAHPAAGGLRGTLEQMNSQLSMITRYVDKMDAYIAKRANMSLADFKALTVSEFWVDAEDALQKGFLDEIVDVSTDAKPNLPFVTNLRPRNSAKTQIDLNY